MYVFNVFIYIPWKLQCYRRNLVFSSTMSEASRAVTPKACCFCGLTEDNELDYGKFHENGDITTHYYCLLLSSNMHQRGNDNDGILGFLVADIRMELRRGKRLACTYCKKFGATLGCCNLKCKRVFHYPCGLRAGSLNQFFGEFRTFCSRHRLKQKIDKQVLQELINNNKANCCICYEHVDPYDKIDTLWAPCCKKNAWFHRKCVQQLALSAGYFFKCPLCNDKKLFQQAMLNCGIFIPSQDASWELVPNAFEELLYRHDQCDAPTCICPKGRKHTSLNAKWELALCRTCGSQGVHMACAQLKWGNPVWECDECKSILGKFNGSSSSATTSGENRRLMSGQTIVMLNDSDSESDISVGNESPTQSSIPSILPSLPQTVSFKERPGPRTYKLRQRLEAKRRLQQARLASRTAFSVDGSEPGSSKTFSVAKSSSPLQSQVDAVSTDDDSDIIEVPKCSSFVNTSMTLKDRTLMTDSNLSLPSIVELTESSMSNDSSIDALKIETVDLGELSSQEVLSDNDSLVPMPNIKITNIISLAPDEFEKTTTFEQELQENDANTSSQLITTPLMQCTTPIMSPSQDDCTESNTKRKLNDTTSRTTTTQQAIGCTNEFKKMKLNTTNTIVLKEIEYVPVYVPLNTIEYASDENDLQSNSGINLNASNEILINKTDTLPYNNSENCDGDAGTSPASGTGNRRNVDHRRNNRNKRTARKGFRMSSSKRNRHQWKCENDTNVRVRDKYECWRRECRSEDCDHSRLMPDYIRLRDLKFRIQDTNNLQMILFNEFLVNIKMNHPATTSNNSIKNNEQNKIKDETLPSGNILQDVSPCHKDNTKTVIINEDYQDDTKENMDPITIPYKNVADTNLLKNATLITNNVTVINSQSENENLKQSASSLINDDEDHTNENSLVDTTENGVKGLSNKCTKIHFLPRSVRRTLFQETPAKEKSKNKIDVKVSIDLQKIQPFVDSNPDLFSKRRKEANEQTNEQGGFLKERNNIKQFAHSSGHNSVADKSNRFGSFTLRLPKYKTIETETVKSIEESTVRTTRRTSNSSKS
ncbi:uncharacterized protein LOC108623397 isoform X2 [Ceratina calcarata]|uniref:Uncharacterized protein LOC108623397 isoform X2 n=1 Tax=Ceratina calcarata TaxID=156304 RepID=A0AAJ7IUL3_9HYME|nr:uncharacterized protein LOC108623397 isoform X2 [Ceratina calcarata]